MSLETTFADGQLAALAHYKLAEPTPAATRWLQRVDAHAKKRGYDVTRILKLDDLVKVRAGCVFCGACGLAPLVNRKRKGGR